MALLTVLPLQQYDINTSIRHLDSSFQRGSSPAYNAR